MRPDGLREPGLLGEVAGGTVRVHVGAAERVHEALRVWVPINPGTDLALILAMSNVLINRDLYDAEYVAANSDTLGLPSAFMKRFV